MTGRAAAWIGRHLPTRETFERTAWLRPVAHRVLAPGLWRFHRRSVSRGVALGFFVGVLIPFAHMIVAALLALPARANVPVAVLATFVSNPLTIPPIWYGAFRLGSWMLHPGMRGGNHRVGANGGPHVGDWMHWVLSDAAPATLAGLLVVATLSAAIGYLVASFGWRMRVARRWRSSRRRRASGGG